MSLKQQHEKAKKFAIEVARLAEDRNAGDIVILDLRESSPVTDFFVIGTGTSSRQLKALSDEIEVIGKKNYSHKPYRVAGLETCEWIVMDYFDVVIHLFSKDLREFYDLELIWGEAQQVDWKRDA